MTAVDHLRDLLHHAAGLLVWPVLLGLLALAAGTIVSLGAFAREALQRARGARHALERDCEALASALDRRESAAPAQAGSRLHARAYAHAHLHADHVDHVDHAGHADHADPADAAADADDLRLEAALQQAERRRWRALSRVRMAVRLGPALGLMGTLIPMANALQGLADGNLPALAGNMVTAFAATVIGLAVSVVAFLMAAVREDWVRADLEQLALQAERLSREPSVTRSVA